MGFRNNQWCAVFSVEPKSNAWTKCRISISKKNSTTGEYETSFSGIVDFMGTACAAKAAALKPEPDHPVRIRLIDVDVDNKYDKEKRIMYWNPKVWNFEVPEDGSSNTTTTSTSATGREDFLQVPDDVEDEGLPW